MSVFAIFQPKARPLSQWQAELGSARIKDRGASEEAIRELCV